MDLNAVRHNVTAVKQRLSAGVRLMAVVKADAYGHGAVRVAKTALNSGADYLGVATVDEAIELREGPGERSYSGAFATSAGGYPAAARLQGDAERLHGPISPSQYAETADAYGMRAPYHLAVNTGMNRIGVRHDEVVEFMGQVSFHRALDLVGTFTALRNRRFHRDAGFQIQVKRFIEAVSALNVAGIDPGIVHAANTAAAVRFPDVHFDMVRLGVGLYGLHPSPVTRPMIGPAARHERACAHHRRAHRSHERGRELRHELPQPREREDLHGAGGVRRRPAGAGFQGGPT